MSLPLTRRIARTALLVAAGAAAGVGAAGSASAAPQLPAAPDLGGMSALDNTGTTVDGATQTTTDVASDAGNNKAVKQAVPAASKTGGKAVKTTGKAVKQTAPVAQRVAGDVAGSASDVAGDTAKPGGAPLPTDGLTKGGLPGTDTLPAKTLPLG
ncbi:ATP-binding protein [Streptomyces sp. NPDC048825]|uniref:ATP-binding protein n=1 Tax=Streptomyces sp. NPDC048825 TaxID=3365592 RepID=UPI003710E8FA